MRTLKALILSLGLKYIYIFFQNDFTISLGVLTDVLLILLSGKPKSGSQPRLVTSVFYVRGDNN